MATGVRKKHGAGVGARVKAGVRTGIGVSFATSFFSFLSLSFLLCLFCFQTPIFRDLHQFRLSDYRVAVHRMTMIAGRAACNR